MSLDVREVSVLYGANRVLDDVSLMPRAASSSPC